jgi:putative addiction module component (TIGR02574 family)
MSATEILEQIRQLPEDERREVAGQILEEFGDFDDELSPEQIEELERRAAEARAHPERGIPWETVRAELFARYKVEQ